MTLLKFDEVVAKQDLPTKDIEVPEWGGTVRIRHWTVAERDEFSRRVKSEDKESVGAWIVSVLAVDENGKQWCPEGKAIELSKKNPKAIDLLVSAIVDLNKVTDTEVENAVKK